MQSSTFARAGGRCKVVVVVVVVFVYASHRKDARSEGKSSEAVGRATVTRCPDGGAQAAGDGDGDGGGGCIGTAGIQRAGGRAEGDRLNCRGRRDFELGRARDHVRSSV